MNTFSEDMTALLLANWETGNPDCAPVLRLIAENGRTFALLNAMNGDDLETVYGLFEFQCGEVVLGRQGLARLDAEFAADRIRIQYIPASECKWPLSAFYSAARLAERIVEDADALNRADAAFANNPEDRSKHMLRAMSVQCVFPEYYGTTVSVCSSSIADGIAHAIEVANRRDGWKSLCDCGPTFAAKAASGLDIDPWEKNGASLSIPEEFTEAGTPPTATITLRDGKVQTVEFGERRCRVIVKDYDCNSVEGLAAVEQAQDDDGRPYTQSYWGS